MPGRWGWILLLSLLVHGLLLGLLPSWQGRLLPAPAESASAAVVVMLAAPAPQAAARSAAARPAPVPHPRPAQPIAAAAPQAISAPAQQPIRPLNPALLALKSAPPAAPALPEPVAKPGLSAAGASSNNQPAAPAPVDAPRSQAAATGERASGGDDRPASAQGPQLRNPPIKVPRRLRQTEQALQGRVVVLIRVSAQGRALRVTVQQGSGNPLIDESVTQQILDNWRFEPARRNGEAIESELPIAVTMIVD
ncbi:energy transducer TonB [Chitinibacter tainanensis]|uniref:energy transducer TonB n=1 Tax=Chitinibacter tainanensis TaxID=230667 RepID=UPI002356119B|nr:energy transducer TonB [Chitinibacter tainanensis]